MAALIQYRREDMKDLFNSGNKIPDGALPKDAGDLLKGDLLKTDVFTGGKDFNLSGTFVIKNKNGLVLDVSGNSKNDNAAIITFNQNNGDNQRFKLEQLSDLSYKITAVHSNKAMTVNDKNKVVQSSWKNTDEQKWKITSNDDGSVKITNVKNGRVLDIPGNSSVIRTEMWTHSDNGTPAQRFSLV
jgi:hypothetical protein